MLGIQRDTTYPDIYCCSVLALILKVAKFQTDKKQARVNALYFSSVYTELETYHPMA